MKYLFVILILATSGVKAQDSLFQSAYIDISDMLAEKKPYDFGRAVFLAENAYMGGIYDYESYERYLNVIINSLNKSVENHPINYVGDDYENIAKNAMIFQYMRDTIYSIDSTYIKYPIMFDFDDFFGVNDYSNVFVTKLINSGSGNCRGLAYFYKILADKIGANANLAIAPNHVYIKVKSQLLGMYNTELTSYQFPNDAWLKSESYISINAIRNKLYMKALNDKETIALTLFDLAKGYEKKYGQDTTFIFKCIDTALEYFPEFVNARLLKAEVMNRLYSAKMKELGTETPSDLFIYSEYNDLFNRMQNIYVGLFNDGYEEMPPKMYADWLLTLKENKEKYVNKKINFETK